MRYFLLLMLAVLSTNAAAHKPSDSYLRLNAEEAAVRGEWDIALRDLDYAIGLDGNDDGAITWGELRAQQAAIAAYALSRLGLSADDKPCRIDVLGHFVDRHSDGAYAVIRFVARCQTSPRELGINYRLFFDLDPQHKGLLHLTMGNRIQTAVLSQGEPARRFALRAAGPWRALFDYMRAGVWHIWIGLDHLLFLITLLLPAVLTSEAGKWQGVANFRSALYDVLKIVTAFTLAHSLTLSLATLGVVSLPSRWVEAAIAASVVLAAINNVHSFFRGHRWVVAFLFGLIHGFGFAGALIDLGLPSGSLALALFGFNVGVEIGQLVVVGVFLPLAFMARYSWFYRRVILGPGSLAIAALALCWLLERALNFKILPV